MHIEFPERVWTETPIGWISRDPTETDNHIRSVIKRTWKQTKWRRDHHDDAEIELTKWPERLRLVVSN